MNKKVLSEIYENGWCILQGLDFLDYKKLVMQLGVPFHTMNVKLVKNSIHSATINAPFLPHTDSPDAKLVAWYVINSDDSSSPMYLIDTNFLKTKLTLDQMKVLSTIKVNYPCIKEGIRKNIELLEFNEMGKFILRYSPNNIDYLNLTDKQRMAIEVLFNELNNITPTEIKFKDDDVLIVDNERMLHGRGEIRINSPRHLFRVWINCNNKYSVAVDINNICN